MNMIVDDSALECDAETFALEAAEADFTLAVQAMIQKLLDEKGLRARDLSKRLNVTEARISQMLGDQAKNLTLKTIARICHQMGEVPVILTESEFDRSILVAKGEYVAREGRWIVSGLPTSIDPAANISVDKLEGCIVPMAPMHVLNRWVKAEEQDELKTNRLATAR